MKKKWFKNIDKKLQPLYGTDFLMIRCEFVQDFYLSDDESFKDVSLKLYIIRKHEKYLG